MKNLIKTILLAVFVFMTQFVSAQSLMGAKAMLQNSTIDLNGSGSGSLIDPTNVLTYSVGAMYQVEMGSGFFFRPELLFTEKGFDAGLTKNFDIFGDLGIDVGVGVKAKSYFVSVPLNLGYSIDLGKAKLQLYGGPTLGYATKAELIPYAKAGIFQINIGKQELDLSKDMYNRLELGGSLGASFAIPVRTGEILLDGRMGRSFTNFLEDPILDIEITNRSYGFGVGYMHRLNSKQ